MVISSSPARSNDQSLVVATFSTTSSGSPRCSVIISIRDIPLSTMPLGCGMRTPPHARHVPEGRGPGWELVDCSGANHFTHEYKRPDSGEQSALGTGNG